jgi:hypothetical protein
MDWLQVDDWWEMLIMGLIVLASLGIIYLIIKQFFSHGGKVKVKGAEITGELEESKFPCDDHIQLLNDITSKLIEMDEERKQARMENSETNKAVIKMIKQLSISQDAILEAMQMNKVGNGNLDKARKALANCYDTQDAYLINQL